MNISIAGGCFLFQDKIDNEALYHSILKRKLQAEFEQQVNVNLIRYERLSSCLNKIIISSLETNPEILIFHLRAEPFLHLCKLYYKFESDAGRIEKTLNLFVAGMSNSDEIELKVVHRIVNKPCLINNSYFNLSNLNYITGALLGNAYFSMKRYMNLINKINEYCFQKNIRLIITSAVPRPNNKIEDILAKNFHYSMKRKMQTLNIPFIDYMKIFNENITDYYCDDLIHINEKGHEKFAEFLSNYLKNTYHIKRIYHSIAI